MRYSDKPNGDVIRKILISKLPGFNGFCTFRCFHSRESVTVSVITCSISFCIVQKSSKTLPTKHLRTQANFVSLISEVIAILCTHQIHFWYGGFYSSPCNAIIVCLVRKQKLGNQCLFLFPLWSASSVSMVNRIHQNLDLQF